MSDTSYKCIQFRSSYINRALLALRFCDPVLSITIITYCLFSFSKEDKETLSQDH